MKCVELWTPTTLHPSGVPKLAPKLAAPSIAAEYTPPWTIPIGWWCSGPISIHPATRAAETSSKCSPVTRMNSLEPSNDAIRSALMEPRTKDMVAR